MQFRTLGRTGLQISALAFGTGPVSTLMVGADHDRQRAVVERAIHAGINWFDTAATYGQGESERSLGRALAELPARDRVHLATKVRLTGIDLDNLRDAIRRSFAASLDRLGVTRVTLLQLHNSITARRGDEPTSITPDDVLQPGGVADVLDELRTEGLVSHLGLTGIGQPEALRAVVESGRFDTVQVPYHLLNPSAGLDMSAGFAETNYDNIIADCARQQMGVMAIRVLAGGALADHPPSPHTLKTPFFPLALYERDRARAALCRERLGPQRPLPREAIRFALAHPQIHSAIIGFADVGQIDDALSALTSDEPPIDWDAFLRSIDQ
jgi:aryl-alcohol dehydrogenase-like predicted oxidoreductase